MKTRIQKILENYNNVPMPARAAFWYMICNVLQRGISLITTPIFSRLLTPDEYGVYSIYQAWYQIIIIFATLNLFYGVYNKGMTEWPDDRKRFTASMQGLTTVITLVFFVVYIVTPDFWNGVLGLDSIYVYAMFVEILCVPAYSFWSAGQRYDYKYRKLILVTLIIVISTPTLGIFCVLNARNRAVARVLSAVFVQICVGLFFYIYNFVKGKCFFIKKYWMYALEFNLPLIPHYLSSTILNQADRLMINSMVGTGEAAVYSVSYNVATIVTIFTTALTNTFTPYMYKAIKNKKMEGIRKNASYLMLMVGVVATVIMAFGPEIIKVFATSSYYEAVWIIPPVAAGIYFKFLYPLFSNFEFYYENTKFVMVASCVGAALNVLLNYIFIPIFGYYAAGYTTLFCYIVYSFAHYFFYKVIISNNNLEKAFDMRVVCGISVVMLIVMVVMTILYNFTMIRYVACFILCLLIILNRKGIVLKIKEIRNNK